jgi:hypothetical protein
MPTTLPLPPSNELTLGEKTAIFHLRAALRKMPASLRCYITDSSIVVCKVGVPSSEVAEEAGGQIFCGSVLTDLHDQFDNGRSKYCKQDKKFGGDLNG